METYGDRVAVSVHRRGLIAVLSLYVRVRVLDIRAVDVDVSGHGCRFWK